MIATPFDTLQILSRQPTQSLAHSALNADFYFAGMEREQMECEQVQSDHWQQPLASDGNGIGRT